MRRDGLQIPVSYSLKFYSKVMTSHSVYVLGVLSVRSRVARVSVHLSGVGVSPQLEVSRQISLRLSAAPPPPPGGWVKGISGFWGVRLTSMTQVGRDTCFSVLTRDA